MGKWSRDPGGLDFWEKIPRGFPLRQILLNARQPILPAVLHTDKSCLSALRVTLR